MPVLLSLVSDLFFSVQIQNAAKQLGWDWVNVESAEQIPVQPPLAPRPGSPIAAQTGSTGHDFIAYVAELQPALIVVEINSQALPWESWVAAAKTSPAIRRIPILAFGSHVDLEQRQRALNAGCDEVVSKGRFTSAMPELLQKHARLPDPAAAQAAVEGELSELARKGIELFNRGEYFEAHEELERAWNEEQSLARELYRGILQVAVAYLQITRNNYNGAIKMFLRARQWLDPLPGICRGVDVATLRQDAAEARAALETLGAERISEFDLSQLQPVKFETDKTG
jgi:predicted metal-dependent hydrolase